MPIQTDKDLTDNGRALWLKARSAIELRNYDYAISLLQAVLKEAPGFLDARKQLRAVEIAKTKGKKSFLSGLSTASLKGGSVMKKDPGAAMESGGWDAVAESGGKKDYRDLIKNKEEAVSLEQKGRVFKDVDMIDTQIAELYPQWDASQDAVDLSRRMAKLYEDRHELEPD